MNHDMEGFKRKGASDGKMMVLKHPKGHEIKVALGALSPAMREKMMSLPQSFDDGGEVEADEPMSSSAPVPSMEDVAASSTGGGDIPAFPPPEASSMAPPQPVDHSAEINQPSSPFGARVVSPSAPVDGGVQAQPMGGGAQGSNQPLGPTGYGTMMSGVGQEKAGMAMEAKAQGDLGHQQSKILKDEAMANDSAITAYKDNQAQMQKTIEDYVSDVKNQHIDPNRYMANMSTGKKIRTVIGLILGGFGAGLTKSENPVLQQMNKAIDQDIESQKVDINTKDNLLKANLLKYGNMNDALKATQVMMNTSASLQMQAAEADAKDPMAKARLFQARGALDQKTAGIVDQMSRQKALQAASNSAGHDGQLSSIDPSKLINFIPAHDQKQAREELTKAQAIKAKAVKAMQDWDTVNEASSKGYALKHPGRTVSGAQMEQLNASIAELNRELTGRFNTDENKKLAAQFAPNRLDTDEDRKLKRENFKHFMTAGRNFNTLSQYGIDPEKFQSTALGPMQSPEERSQAANQQQHAQWSQWAQQNPSNPLAQKYMQKMGGK